MGSRNTRSSQNNNPNDQEEQEAENHDGRPEDDVDLVRVLSHLLRGGLQVQFIRATQSHGGGIHIIQGVPRDDDDDDDDDDDEDLFYHGMKQRHTSQPVDYVLDTKNLENSDLKKQVMLSSGQMLSKTKNITAQLKQREVGGLSQQRFSGGEKAFASSNYLPNTMETKARYRQKAFCGTYSQDGKVFLSACQDEYIRLYDTTHGQFYNFRSIKARDIGWSIIDTAYSPDQNYLIYSSWSDYIHLCNIYGDYNTHIALDLKPRSRRFCAFSIEFSQDNKEIIAGSNDSCIYIYDRESDQRILRILGHDQDYDVNAVTFADSSAQILFSGSDDGLCKVWDRRMLNESHPLPVGVFAGHSDGLTFIHSKNDSHHLITNSKDQTIKLWDLRKFSSEEAVQNTQRAVDSQHWDYRWQNVPRKILRTKTLPGDSSIMTYRGHVVRNTLIRCYFSPAHTTGQRYIYTGSSSGNVVIYDVLTGEVKANLTGHRECVRDVSWHPYDNKIVSTSWDGTVALWQYKNRNDLDDELDAEPPRKVAEDAQE
ncbi:DDB1- and CUL4-associated factor 11 [Exaiptasia diaphana]|uniref:DDB1- and CUL4-associated factor 11 n=1 Tax=Exaiptasia diaphana TaxID=2652724 RepID=A0A913WZP7_EXADI|nr:DDB1- and CUL4-associated factor 11 [Exaiptasia diaphana]KXJ16439.1 DDB1- and CUL4-associated factor 11 [Exaiptasia diaphana]